MKQIVFLFFLALGLQLHGQAILFDQNKSGFALGGSLSSNQGNTVFLATPSYVSNGKLELGFSFGSSRNEDSDLNATLVGPNIGYLVMKQGENNNPVSIGLKASYGYFDYTAFEDLSASALSLGGNLQHEIVTGDGVSIIPGGAISWNRTSVNVTGFGSVTDSNVDFTAFGTVKIKKFYFEPQVIFSSGSTLFNFAFGFIFPQK
jgi:hypothetical protein